MESPKQVMMIMRRLIPRIMNKLNLLDKFNLASYVTLNKRRIIIPIMNKIGYSNLWVRESWMVDLLKRLLPLKNGAFIDIGVNLGQTLMRLKCVESDIRYLGFEPNPLCVYYTRELIKKNGFHNCEIIPVGISIKNDLVTLNCYSDETDSAATILEGFRPEEEIKHQFLVPVQTFECVYKKLNLGKTSIIKIDVEGGELEVIRSLASVLAEDRPFILCEILPVYSENNSLRKSRQEEIEETIRALNYDICRIEKARSGSLKGLIRIDRFGVHSDLSLCDYLFVPDEILEDVAGRLGLKQAKM